MNDVVVSIIKTFEHEIKTLDLNLAINNTVSRLREANCDTEAIPHLLSLIEKYPHFNWGSPGGFAHFMENLEGSEYETYLLESYQRQATSNTAFLMYRRAHKTKDSHHFVSILKDSLKSISDPKLKEEVEEYIEWLM